MFEIFGKLGGEHVALDIITKRSGVTPSSEAVRGWKRLKRIPAGSAILLSEECKKRGIPCTWPDDFVAQHESEPAQ